MFNLTDRLSPDEFIDTFFEVNKRDHQRPPHPWDALFRDGRCTKEQLQGWGQGTLLFHETGAHQGILDSIQLPLSGSAPILAA
jgi:hypothetical protein